MTENENSFESGIANLRLVGGRPKSSASSPSSSRHPHPHPHTTTTTTTPPAPPPSSSSSSFSFEDRYTLVRELQNGSYGTVYVGVHNVRNRECAVKVIDRR